MALYPGWGVGGRIKLSGWARKFEQDGAEGEICVTFKLHRDSTERFGHFRSMDILRLWASNGLDKIASDFYSQVDSMESEETQVRKRKAILDEIDVSMKRKIESGEVMLFSRNKYGAEVTPDTSRYNIYEVVYSGEGSMPEAMLKVANMFNLNAQNFVKHFLDLESSGAFSQQPRSHYGYNDSTGIRRWMLSAGLRIFKRENEAVGTIDSNFDAPPNDYEVMQHVASLGTSGRGCRHVDGCCCRHGCGGATNRTYKAAMLGLLFTMIPPMEPGAKNPQACNVSFSEINDQTLYAKRLYLQCSPHRKILANRVHQGDNGCVYSHLGMHQSNPARWPCAL